MTTNQTLFVNLSLKIGFTKEGNTIDKRHKKVVVVLAVLLTVMAAVSAEGLMLGIGGGLDWVQMEGYTQMLPKASVSVEFPNAAHGTKMGFGMRAEVQGVFKPISARESLADVLEEPKKYMDTEAWGVDATADMMCMVYRNYLQSSWYIGAGYGLSFASHGMFMDTHPKSEDFYGFDTNYALVGTAGVLMNLAGGPFKLRVEANYRNLLDSSGQFKDPSISALAAVAMLI